MAFIALGLTVGLHTLPDGGAWVIGLTLAVLLTFVVRPLLVGVLLLPVRLTWGERLFVLWAGLKGAVPILLGTFLLTAGERDATRLYAVIFVVVAFSVVVQGGLVPAVAARLRVLMRPVEPAPWTLGVRFRHDRRDCAATSWRPARRRTAARSATSRSGGRLDQPGDPGRSAGAGPRLDHATAGRGRSVPVSRQMVIRPNRRLTYLI